MAALVAITTGSREMSVGPGTESRRVVVRLAPLGREEGQVRDVDAAARGDHDLPAEPGAVVDRLIAEALVGEGRT